MWNDEGIVTRTCSPLAEISEKVVWFESLGDETGEMVHGEYTENRGQLVGFGVHFFFQKNLAMRSLRSPWFFRAGKLDKKIAESKAEGALHLMM